MHTIVAKPLQKHPRRAPRPGGDLDVQHGASAMLRGANGRCSGRYGWDPTI